MMTTNDLISDDQLEDYLDGVLDDFSDKSVPTKPTQAKATEIPIPDDLGQLDEAFIKQLAENMEMMLALDTGTEPSPQAKEPSASSPAPAFQKTVTETIEKLRESSHKVNEQVAQDVNASLSGLPGLDGLEDADLEGMMKELEGLMESGEFDEMFSGVFDQLMTRDVLYEPMKELSQQYPVWLEANKSTISQEEYSRYQSQSEVVNKIVKAFELKGQPDEQTSAVVLQYMTEMQSFGNPPESLLKTIAPDMEVGEDGLPKLPDGIKKDDCKMM